MVSYKIDSLGNGWLIFNTTTSFPFNFCNENDPYCFKQALISALKMINRPQRCSAYNIDISLEIISLSDEIKFDFTGLTSP